MNAEGLPLLVVTHSQLDRGTRLAYHHHPHHLIVWETGATVTVRTDGRDWLVPPTHGLWIPAATPHAVDVLHPGGSCVVAVDARCPISWTEPTGVLITPLIRELITYLHTHPAPHRTRTRVESVLLDLLEPTPSTSLHVPLPADPRLRTIADALIADPADQRDLAAWGHEVGAGVRTLTRLFSAETGMTFGRWRTHVRIRAALTLLARGTSIGATARAVGYGKPGAFSDAFHRVTGRAPSIYHPNRQR
ncbi:helix-turn-helix domain-containing protein [Nocardia transvalensis]|uniref:helix-turn-helix domain-containing protein n=1 Tax=Nocardia transvalensis TaxID=37333 RepID=UPI0018957464|nr:AraC family transcriptional regulator [Nocardia transvalensis]MBF6330310.1 helix-turn-helix domain-containing protein [Nocardia transvalensis]